MDKPDIRVENHGSIYLLRSLSVMADEWFHRHIPDDAQWLGDALAVEPRYLDDIVNGAREAGLEVG